MIDLYYWPTPNGWKITIMLEELALPYKIVPVNIGRGEQFEDSFLRLSPNNKMPAIVDHDAPGRPLTLFESGAILLYLAEKTGQLCPRDPHGKAEVTQWLFWQMAGLGPMSGQANYFRNYLDEKVPQAIDRFTKEVNRLYGVMDRRLADRPCLGGAYSIADIACWPWVTTYERVGQRLEDFPNVKRWYEDLGRRPAVQRGKAAGAELRAPLDEAAKKVLFGQTNASVAGAAAERKA